MGVLIEPKLLKGFRDFLPEEEMARKEIIAILENTFQLFGFLPIDTPVLEYAEVLLGKGGGETDKQVYRFQDHGDRDVALRFDLTVPFARFMAGHSNELYTPFKRYHISKVWRGENTQRGRYREFTQCDFDIVGVDSSSADFEILLLMTASFQALGITDITIHVSHRGILNDFLETRQIQNQSVEILRTVDKVGKIGKKATMEQLSELVGERNAEDIFSFIRLENDNVTTLEKLKSMAQTGSEGIARLLELMAYSDDLDLSSWFVIDPSITRGLDYYTGIVYETFLQKAHKIGSVCSGGRYNNLASLYSKERFPGVGSSIGLDRLLAALETVGTDKTQILSVEILILNMDDRLTGYYHKLAQLLRGEKMKCEVYPENKKLAKQFQYAEKKKIPFALICGEDERVKNVVSLKNLNTRKSHEELSIKELTNIVRKELYET